MQESKPKRSPWLIGLGLFFVGLVIGGAVIGASRELNSASSSTVTVTAGSNAPVLKVLATFFPLQNWAAAVGGDRANVSLLVRVSIDVHDFEPGPADLEAIAQANLLVLNGAGLEPWAPAVLAAAGNPQLAVVNCSLGINLIKVPPEFQAGDRTIDPHIWNNPVDAIAMVKNILAGYIQADPADASYFAANANAYIRSLQVLNQEFMDLANSKLGTRDFVTFHTAWGYFAQQYDLTQIPVFGPFEEEPTPADIQSVVNAINQNKLCYVGYESLSNPAVVQAIASQTHATLVPMDPNEGLTDQQVAVRETYLTMMQTMLFIMTLALKNVGC
jgi:zinc transport system substrate-binding protein